MRQVFLWVKMLKEPLEKLYVKKTKKQLKIIQKLLCGKIAVICIKNVTKSQMYGIIYILNTKKDV